MKSYHSFANKEIKTRKVTSVLVIIAVMLSAMMTTVIGQSLGILQAMRIQQAGILNGNRYATFRNLTYEQKSMLENDRRLSFVGSNIVLGEVSLKNSGLSLQLREYDDNGLAVYPAITRVDMGQLPSKAGEIALPRDALDFLGFMGDIGDIITLDLSVSLPDDYSEEEVYRYSADFTLSGILKSNYLGYSTGIIAGIAGPGTAKTLLPEKYQVYSVDFRTADKRTFQHIVNDLADKTGISKRQIHYNWLYLDTLGIQYGKNESGESTEGGFSYMTAAGIVVGLLVLTAAGLVIYSVLKIEVSRRIKEYGIIRAIGGQRIQLYVLVAKQLFLLCLIGIPSGVLLGLLSAAGITTAATNLFSPESFLVQSKEELNTLIEYAKPFVKTNLAIKITLTGEQSLKTSIENVAKIP